MPHVRDNLALLTSESLDLVGPHLPPTPARILEVGCGAGDFSLALKQRGYDVLGLDANEENVARTREKGVEAVAATWPDFVDLPFDAILFTRSLHHIQPVSHALRRASELLIEGGTLIVEEFAFHEANSRTILWFKSIVDVLDAAGVLDHGEDRLAIRIAQADNAEEAWQLDHVDIAPAVELHAAIITVFSIRAGAQTPHLYRYVAQVVTPDVAVPVVTAVLNAERAAARARAIDPIGRFWVAIRK